MNRSRASIRLVLTCSAAAVVSGCVVKYSQHQLEEPWFDKRLDEALLSSLEIGLMTGNIELGPVSGLAFSLDAARQYLDNDAVPPLVDFDRVGLSSVTLGARFFPFDRGPLRPYGGAGFGRSHLSGRWTGPNYDVARYNCVGACESTYTETFYSGYHPHLVGGVELRTGPTKGSLIFEYRKDIGRGDDFYRLDGSRFSFGLRYRFTVGR